MALGATGYYLVTKFKPNKLKIFQENSDDQNVVETSPDWKKNNDVLEKELQKNVIQKE